MRPLDRLREAMTDSFTLQPLVSLALTVAVFAVARSLSSRSREHPFANPVLVSVVAIIALLCFAGTSYESYFEGAQFIHFLLGPAVVALAIPLCRNLGRIRRSALPILVGIVAGSTSGALSIVLIAWAFGAHEQLAASLVTKSVTAPVSMAIAPQLGGVPALAALFSVLTGMIGAAFGPTLLNRLGIDDPLQRGLAMGTASHGQGTARILQESEEAGAFSALAMGLTALTMAVLLPAVSRLIS
jgi:predicted murein hydrolase (TIGR00659 family)